jgi:hypothetical protein
LSRRQPRAKCWEQHEMQPEAWGCMAEGAETTETTEDEVDGMDEMDEMDGGAAWTSIEVPSRD